MRINNIEVPARIKGPLLIRKCHCGRFLGLASAQGASAAVSHGYCPPCFDRQVTTYEKYRRGLNETVQENT